MTQLEREATFTRLIGRLLSHTREEHEARLKGKSGTEEYKKLLDTIDSLKKLII